MAPRTSPPLPSKSTYIPLSHAYAADSDSDTVAASISSLERALPKSVSPRRLRRSYNKIPSRRSWEICLTWLRWSCVVGLQSAMILLLILRSKGAGRGIVVGKGDVEAGGDINGLFPKSNHVYKHLKFEEELYMPNMTSNADRLEVRRRWDMLMPLGSGSLSIPNHKSYPLLGPPLTDDRLRSGPLYEASWTHALQCLYYSVDAYHQLLLSYNSRSNSPSTTLQEGQDSGDKWIEPNPVHASHCFEYLRHSILCSLDMTLEGDDSAHRDGGGQAHVCRDPEQARAWIEERRVDDRRDIVGP